MQQKIKLLLCSIIFTVVSSVASAQTIVYGFELKNRMSVEGGEQFDLLWQELHKLGLEFDLKVVSFSRQVRLFSRDRQSCMFPSSVPAVKRLIPEFKEFNLQGSEGIDLTGLVALTLDDSSNIHSRADLSGKSIAMWVGLDPKIFLVGVDYKSLDQAPNDETLLRMLSRKRVEVILGFMPDILLAAEKLSIALPHSTDVWLIKKRLTQVVCHDTVENRKFLVKFNQLMKGIRSSGKLREFMGPLVNLNDGSEEFY
ncbi:MAG: hypothetical protein MJK10_05760 [Pseudomonadales bacterium]|nr:hypothetical protein [Pseudomonadales bacterium]NRA14202.1 hypothetical protein [Oceanospirillaceae bacterium]